MSVNGISEIHEPLVSVIVPIYNISSYLDRCIESILAQTYQRIEVLLVDDGSTDGSGVLCDEWSLRDSRIRVVHKPNGGLSSARNEGIDRSSGSYLMFIDGDDYIDSNMTSALVHRASETRADLVICGFSWVRESGDVIRSEHYVDTIMNQKQFWEAMYSHCDSVQSGYFVVAWNKLYSRKLFLDERYDVGKIHEDEYILHRLIDQCRYISTVDGCYYNYVQRSGSITHREQPRSILDVAQAISNRSAYFSNKGMEFESLVCCVDIATTLCRIPTRINDTELKNRRLEIERNLLSRLKEGDFNLLSIKQRLKLFAYLHITLLYRTLIYCKRLIH